MKNYRQQADVVKQFYHNVFCRDGMTIGHAVSCFIGSSRGIKPTKSPQMLIPPVPLAAALVRHAVADRPDQIMDGVRGQFVQTRILMHLPDQQFQIPIPPFFVCSLEIL